MMEHWVNLVGPKQPSEASLESIRLLTRRVLTLFAFLWLVGVPITHEFVHAASESDLDETSDPDECQICQVVASSPAIDVASPICVAAAAPIVVPVVVEVPAEPLFESDPNPTDFARGPPAFAPAPTGRHSPT